MVAGNYTRDPYYTEVPMTKKSAASKAGSALARARAKALTPERRKAISRAAATARWAGMSDEDRRKAVEPAAAARRKS